LLKDTLSQWVPSQNPTEDQWLSSCTSTL
jgi:hypothetical protein